MVRRLISLSPLLLLILLFSGIPSFGGEKPKSAARPSNERPTASSDYKKKHTFALGNQLNSASKKDGRWNQMETGPLMSSALKTKNEVIRKAISIPLDKGKSAGASFDTKNLSLKTGWTEGFLYYNPARFGLVHSPRMVGRLQFSAPAGSGWDHKNLKYHGLYLHNKRVVFSYSIDGISILETHKLYRNKSGLSLFSRTLKIASSDKSLTGFIADPSFRAVLRDNIPSVKIESKPDQPVKLIVAPRTNAVQFEVLIVGQPQEILPADEKAREVEEALIELKPTTRQFSEKKIDLFLAEIRQDNSNQIDIKTFTQPGKIQWGEPLITKGHLGKEQGAYVIDTIDLPHENRFAALMFVGDHDYFSKPGEFALCTVHGDVWLVNGVDSQLKKVTWRRFATGLYQPLGLKIINDQIYVIGRDQLTRLHDLNDDGEADFYEAFAHSFPTSAARHDYATCLEVDPEGNFYFVNGTGLHIISKDGKKKHSRCDRYS